MKLFIVIASVFFLLAIGVWGIYFFGGSIVDIPSIPDALKPIVFEKPNIPIKVDLPVPEGETVLLVKKGKTRGLEENETLIIAKEAVGDTLHMMIFDSQKSLLYEKKGMLVAPNDVQVKTFEKDTHPSFYCVLGSNQGYFVRWNGYQYAVPENEKDLSSR